MFCYGIPKRSTVNRHFFLRKLGGIKVEPKLVARTVALSMSRLSRTKVLSSMSHGSAFGPLLFLVYIDLAAGISCLGYPVADNLEIVNSVRNTNAECDRYIMKTEL